MTPPDLTAVRTDLATSGVLRVGLNLSNFLLVGTDPATGAYRGIVIDLARELARRLGVPVEFTGYPSPGKVTEGARDGAWDVAFIAVEPARAAEISFSSPYVEIQSTYLVRADSPFQTITDIDRPGVRVAVSATSAYDLYLTRTLQHAQLVRAPGIDASYDLFVNEKLDVLAGLRPRLEKDVLRLPGARVLEGGFTSVQQAIGTPRKNAAGAAFLQQYAADIKASGLVARVIAANRIEGVTVAA